MSKSFKLRAAIAMAIIAVLAPIALLSHHKSAVEKERLLRRTSSSPCAR